MPKINSAGSPRTLAEKLGDRAISRYLQLPPATCDFRVERGLKVPMRDGVMLLADRYNPVTPAVRGTLLVRDPYGRRPPYSNVYARVFAERGYQVVMQSNRGTFGSGGTFTPFADDVADSHDTIAWLREQPWFSGTFATVGMSYLGWNQWALLSDAPAELVASVVVAGPTGLGHTAYGTGAFALETAFGWADSIATQEKRGWFASLVVGTLTAQRRSARGVNGLPLLEMAEKVLGGRSSFYEGWISHEDASDKFWRTNSVDVNGRGVPILLVGGWSDVFLEQTLHQYETLRARGANVALTVGPWNHVDTLVQGSGIVTKQTLSWLSQHLAGGTTEAGSEPVRVLVTGADTWKSLPSWPPATQPDVWHLHSGGELSRQPAAESSASTEFTYDPSNPTPTVGGRTLNPRAGRGDNKSRETRPDVLTFTSEPLGADLEVAGNPLIELHHTASTPFYDVMVRVCEVDSRGKSTNVSDAYVRLRADVPVLHLTADAIHHVFKAGTRVRVQVAAGSHPHYDRNLGTGEPVATGVRMVPVTHTIRHDLMAPSTVSLPIVNAEK